MKTLNKILLKNVLVLEAPELKFICGGSGESGGSGNPGGSGIGAIRFRCSCNPGVIAVPWEVLCVTSSDIVASIASNCGSGGGSCTQI